MLSHSTQAPLKVFRVKRNVKKSMKSEWHEGDILDGIINADLSDEVTFDKKKLQEWTEINLQILREG